MKPFVALGRLGFALLFVVACRVASAQITKEETGYLLRMKFTKGNVVNFLSTTASSGKGLGAQAMTLRVQVSTKVLFVANGVADVEYRVSPTTNNGKAITAARRDTSKIDSRGRLTGGTARLQNMGDISLPEEPIPVGGVWKNTETSQAPSGPISIQRTFRFVGFKKVDGKQLAQIEVSLTGGNQEMRATGTGTTMLLVADGSLFSSTLNLSTSFDRGSLTLTDKTSIVRQ